MTFAEDVIAKSESNGDDGFTIRHVNCEVIVVGGDDASTARCSYCTHHRKALSAMVRRSTTGSDEIKSKRLDASSHTNYTFFPRRSNAFIFFTAKFESHKRSCSVCGKSWRRK